MTAQPSNCIHYTVFSPLFLSRLTFSFSFYRHLLCNFAHQHACSSSFQACAALASRHPSRQPPQQLPNGTTGDPQRSPFAQFIVDFIQLSPPGRGKRHWFTRRASQQSVLIRPACCALHAPVIHPACVTARFELYGFALFRSTSAPFRTIDDDSMPPIPGSPDVSGELGWGAAWRLIGPLQMP
jgi:hypothetical protein